MIPSQQYLQQYHIPDQNHFKGNPVHVFNNDTPVVCDVWASNFQQQMNNLMHLTEHFSVIALDTEFPGIFVKSHSYQGPRSEEEDQYLLIRQNVDKTKLIQVGFSIADQNGRIPVPYSTWQFNLKFDIDNDNIAKQSEIFLRNSGIMFTRLKSEGIDYMDFAEFLEASGFVYNKKIKWVAFHGTSDITYLLRLLMNRQLPFLINEFYLQSKKYFPIIYDLKFICQNTPSIRDVSLKKLSVALNCMRIGHQHQAGFDSCLTLTCYFKMKECPSQFDPSVFHHCENVIYGIGRGFVRRKFKKKKQVMNGQHFQYEKPEKMVVKKVAPKYLKQLETHELHQQFRAHEQLMLQKNSQCQKR